MNCCRSSGSNSDAFHLDEGGVGRAECLLSGFIQSDDDLRTRKARHVTFETRNI